MSKIHHSVIREKAVLTAVNILEGLGADYKIIMPDGAEFGGLKIAPAEPPKKKRASTLDGRKYGELTAYFRPLIEAAKPGDIIDVPYATYTARALARCLTAWTCTHWGKGSVITARLDDRLEIMRIK